MAALHGTADSRRVPGIAFERNLMAIVGTARLNPLAVAAYVAVFAGNTFIIDQPFHTTFSDSGTANGH